MKLPDTIRNPVKKHLAVRVSLVMLVLVLIISCEKEKDFPDYNPPGDHTLSKDGIMHKSGLNQPMDNCINCHGADLKGGSSGVSCYECHGEAW